MAFCDYYACDLCGERKTFYDANLHYDFDEDWSHGLWGAGDMAVICSKCAETHQVFIVQKRLDTPQESDHESG